MRELDAAGGTWGAEDEDEADRAAAVADNRAVIYLTVAAARVGVAAIECIAVSQAVVSRRWRCLSSVITSVRSSNLLCSILSDAAAAAAAAHHWRCLSSAVSQSDDAVFF